MKFIDIINEGAMMDDGRAYIFSQAGEWAWNNELSISIRANDEEEARDKLRQIIGEAESLGIEFAEGSWHVVSSY